MKKIYLIAASVLGMITVFGQLGINTKVPNTTIDIQVKRDTSGNITDNSLPIGLQAPRLTRAELTTTAATYGANHIGAIIYITDVTGGDSSPVSPRKYIDTIGYYEFDGVNWIKMDTSLYNNNGTIPAATTRAVTLANRLTSRLSISPINEQAIISNLDIIGGNETNDTNDITTGITIADNYLNNTEKYAAIKVPQTRIANPPTLMLSADNNALSKNLYIGGQSSTTQASPNNINFQVNESSDLSTSSSTGIAHTAIFIRNTGAVGISNTAPAAALDITGYLKLGSSDPIVDAPGNTEASKAGNIRYTSTDGFQFHNGSNWVSLVNVYNSDGILTGNRTVTQGANTLSFAGTAVNAFSVAGNTFSVDASNGRIGIGTGAPQKRLDVVAGNDAIRIESLSQGTLPAGILYRPTYDFTTGDVVYTAISNVFFTPSLAPGQSATFTDTSGILSGSFAIETGNICGRAMLSDFYFTGTSLSHLASIGRNAIGIATKNDTVNASDWTVNFPGVIACQDGGDGTQFDFRVAKTAANVYVVTNLGNIARIYELTVQR